MADRKRRSFVQRMLDRQWAKYVGLPPATDEYSTRGDLQIPMRDGVTLLADLYEPTTPKGTILSISPYGWNRIAAAINGTLFACRGYRVLLVRCRGTFGSGGAFEPFRHEAADAADVVAWMRQQPWWDGHFATFGYSYIGFTQWALLTDPPPELRTAVIACSPYDFHRSVYPGGAFMLSSMLEWSFLATTQEKPLPVRIFVNLASKGRIARALKATPEIDAARAVMKDDAPWYSEWVSRRDDADEWWAPTEHGDALERVDVPVLLQGGWQDAFIRPTLAAYSRLVARGVPVALTVGPWTHAQGGGEGAKVLLTDALAWFDEHHDQAPARTEPVRFFTAGASEGWRTLAVWPPPTTNRTWHPRSDGALLESSTSSPDVREFRYDPADPTPTYGGAFVTSLSPGYEAGYVDDTELVQRPDVLSFTSEPLVGGLDILGAPMAHIAHSSDNPHADLFVRVSDIDESGRSRNVSDGFVRLDKGSTGPVRIDFEPTAYRVAPGHRIRFVIAGGSHPRWERNLGTDENPAISSRMVPSHRTIDLAGTQIVLPIDIASGRN